MLPIIKQTYNLLTSREKKHFWLLIGFTIVSSVVQMVGIGAIFPFLMTLLEPEKIQSNVWLAHLQDLSRVDNSENFVTLLGIAAISLFLLGLAFKLATEYLTRRFAFGRQFRWSNQLFRSKLNISYTDYVTQNSAEAITQVTTHISQYTNQLLLPLLQILINAFLVIAIVGLLFSTSPVLALVLAVLIGGGYGLFYKGTAPAIQKSGVTLRDSMVTQTRLINESMTGFKEIRVLGRTSTLLNAFRQASDRARLACLKYQFLVLTPGFAMQALMVVVLFGLILFFFRFQGNPNEAIALLGFYGLATKQLSPALSSILSALQSVKQTSPVAEILIPQLQQVTGVDPISVADACIPERVEPLAFDRAITFDSTHFGYPGTDKQVLKGLDLTIPKNSTVAIVGTTGAGKTTAIDLLIGLLEPTEGSILIDDQPLNSDTIPQWQQLIGYVPQQIFLSDTTIRENIALGIPTDQIDHQAVERAAQMAQIHDFISQELTDGYDSLVGDRGIRLSGGQRQRIGIARAMYHQPQVIILDEATSALDNQTEREFARAVQQLGSDHTIIIIAHRMSTVEQADQVILLDQGKNVATGTYQQMLATTPAFRQLAAEPQA